MKKNAPKYKGLFNKTCKFYSKNKTLQNVEVAYCAPTNTLNKFISNRNKKNKIIMKFYHKHHKKVIYP